MKLSEFTTQRDVGQDICTVVQAAFRPFVPRAVIAHLSEPIPFGRKLHVEARFSEKSYDFTLAIDEALMYTYPEDAYSAVYREVFNHYRNRPTPTIEDNIHLGEE